MTELQWNDEFQSNVEILDEQHRKVIDLLNDLNGYAKAGQISLKQVENAIDILDEYVTLHFQLEESYSLKYNFPKYEQLVQEHNIFRSFYKSLRYYYSKYSEIREISSNMIIYLNVLMTEWFKTHITTLDKEFALFIKDKHIEIK